MSKVQELTIAQFVAVCYE